MLLLLSSKSSGLSTTEAAALADAAMALAVSPRTLQRRLLDLGTSFRSEAQTARLERAQGLLRDTELPITTIALEVASSNETLRVATAASPSAA